MKVTKERLPDCEVKLTVEIESKQLDKSMRQTARRLARQVRVPGFRPGKAPFNVILRRFGREALIEEMLEKEGQGWYEKALEEAELEPYGQAQFNTDSFDPLVLAFTLPVEPVVKLGDYREIRLEWESPQVSDEDVEKELARLQQEKAKLEPGERPAELEDMATLDVKGRIGDELVVDLSERPVTLNPDINYPVIGFADKIVGMSIGEDREFTLVYPEDHANAAWAGKEANFEVHMRGLKVWVTPDLDDELAKEMGDYETLDEWRSAVRKELEAAALNEVESKYADTAIEALVAQSQIEFPAVMVERELDNMVREMDQSLQQRGLGLDNYLSMIGQDKDEHRESLRENAQKRVRGGLALSELIKAESLQVSESEIEAEIDRMAEDLGEQEESFRQLFAMDEMRESLRGKLLSQAAVDVLKEIARGEYMPPPSEPEVEEETEETEAAAEETETAVEETEATAKEAEAVAEVQESDES